MYPLKRIAAYVIDYVIVLLPVLAGLEYVEYAFARGVSPMAGMYFSLAAWGYTLVAPSLVLGTLTGLTGRTPGKLLLALRVQDYGGDPPGLAQGILREIVKSVSLACGIGMFYALQTLTTRKCTFYDEWLDLEVEDLKPVGLTPTQKNFRKYMREKQRRDARKPG